MTTPSHLPPRPVRALLLMALLALVVIGAGAWWFGRAAPSKAPLSASGTIEVDEVTLSAQAAGRLADLSVDEGTSVMEGQLIGHLVDPVLEVQVKQAITDAAQLQVAQAQMLKLELRAPVDGVVQKQIARRGEYVGPGTPILTVANPTDLKLTLYVLEADLGQVSVGQNVGIHADAFPERTFGGRVQTIATRAEFTPRNVQTQKDRQNLVFAVTVRVPNPDNSLKAGLPVDASFER